VNGHLVRCVLTLASEIVVTIEICVVECVYQKKS
jgi:hypothetical protein